MNPGKITPKLAGMMSKTDRKALGILTIEQRREKIEGMAERELQRLCENWLTLHGFRRRSPEDIVRPGPCAGWFVHLHEAKHNPILLDILILHDDGRWQEVELKTATGKTTREQEALIARGGHLCRTLEEFIKVVKINKNGFCPHEKERGQ